MKHKVSTIKKYVSVLLLLVFSISPIKLHAYEESISQVQLETESIIEVITNPEILSAIQSTLSDVPNGYSLVEVVRYGYSPFGITSSKNGSINRGQTNESALINYWQAKNIRKDSYDIYFPSNPLISDWITGPADYEQTYTQEVSASFSSNTGISSSVVSASIGFSAGYKATLSRSFRVQCSASERLNIKVFANYAQWRYDAYLNGFYLGLEFAHKPIGLFFDQYRYAK